MAKLTRDEFISALKEMTLLEINDLVEAMKDEFGIDPSSVAVAAAPEVGVVNDQYAGRTANPDGSVAVGRKGIYLAKGDGSAVLVGDGGTEGPLVV